MDHPSSAHSHRWHQWLDANVSRYLLFARSQTRCEADARDLLQDALVEVWRRASHQPPDDALVFKTLRRRAIDLGRRIDRRERREQTTLDWWQEPGDDPDAAPDRDAGLAQAVQALPASLREVVLLKIWGGLTFREVAETLGVPLQTAASRYRYALDHLRHALKEVNA